MKNEKEDLEGDHQIRQQPWTWSKAFGSCMHQTHQKFMCSPTKKALNMYVLVESLPCDWNPVQNWQTINQQIDNANGKEDDPGPHEASSHREVGLDQITSWFPSNAHVVFYGPSSDTHKEQSKYLTYAQLHEQVRTTIFTFDIIYPSTTCKEQHVLVVALLLPPSFMAEIAVILVALLSLQDKGISIAPIDPGMTPNRIITAMEQLQCTALITTESVFKTVKEGGLICLHDMFQDIRFVSKRNKTSHAVLGDAKWTTVKKGELKPSSLMSLSDDSIDLDFVEKGSKRPFIQPALLLRTSGTTALPKIVPLTISSLLYNAMCLASSLQLSTSDIGCNVMPLFHIGGIVCNILSVLVSGSSMIMMQCSFDSGTLYDAIVYTDSSSGQENRNGNDGRSHSIKPTWYYAAPSIHKALLLTAKARLHNSSSSTKVENAYSSLSYRASNKLRFIRSGAAHLPYNTARELAEIFDTVVIPTYSMSECMPICSSHDEPVIDDGRAEDVCGKENDLMTVGPPLGCSLAIFDENDQVLPYSIVGEVCIRGPGVIQGYIGIPYHESHTIDGWFRTGDMGMLDTSGRLVLTGRKKELIKRGGEQIWPNEIDEVIEGMKGIKTAVSFGVANNLWGEEVQVAVVMEEDINLIDRKTTSQMITERCESMVGHAATPTNIFYTSSEGLLQGPTGKYLRRKMATHFGAIAKDLGAMRLLERQQHSSRHVDDSQSNPVPSSALNALRFLMSIYVVQFHIGLLPNNALVRVQDFHGFRMTIFFVLGAFQMTCSVKSSVKSNASAFVGTKIGSLHAMFLLSQIMCLSSYLLLQCGVNGYQMQFENRSCVHILPYYLPAFVINTLTALYPTDPSNPTMWFITSFYLFIVAFPFVDHHLRRMTLFRTRWIFAISLSIASVACRYIFSLGGLFYLSHNSFPAWVPTLLCAMVAAYYFSRTGPFTSQRYKLLRNPMVWAVMSDAITILFVTMIFIVAMSPDDFCVAPATFEKMRPEEKNITETEFALWRFPDVFRGGSLFSTTLESYIIAKDVTHEEYVQYVYPDFIGNQCDYKLGFSGHLERLGTPIILIWVLGLAHGHGLTAAVLKWNILQHLSKYSYHLYLFHIPISRFYWVATRGYQAEKWWNFLPYFPLPVEWYETYIIMGITLFVAVVCDRLLIVTNIQQYTIQSAVALFQRCFRKSLVGEQPNIDVQDQSQTFLYLEKLLKEMTGINNVSSSTRITNIGLDSIGATAFLGLLKASLPTSMVKSITLRELNSCETLGDLVLVLEDDISIDDNRE